MAFDALHAVPAELQVLEDDKQEHKPPSPELMVAAAQALRQQLRLTFFGFDLIQHSSSGVYRLQAMQLSGNAACRLARAAVQAPGTSWMSTISQCRMSTQALAGCSQKLSVHAYIDMHMTSRLRLLSHHCNMSEDLELSGVAEAGPGTLKFAELGPWCSMHRS